MGTNYYANIDPCPHCGKPVEKVHIGKSSVGWQFLLNPYRKTWKEWKEFLVHSQAIIVDEYGGVIGLAAFIKLVEKKQEDKNAFSASYYSQVDHSKWETVDPEGYRISRSPEFC